jgi:outer membrane protein assembly factor BamE (lipoprotein component of BamABCDE complex)
MWSSSCGRLENNLVNALWTVRGAVIVVCVVLLAGCSVRRVVINDTIAPQQVAFIRSGSTTMPQVVAVLGAPDEIQESEFGLATIYQWSDTKASGVDFGFIARAFLPYSPSMTLARTGIDMEQLHVHYDEQGVVRTFGFTRHEPSRPLLWFWPF